jgi:hypothetical protein
MASMNSLTFLVAVLTVLVSSAWSFSTTTDVTTRSQHPCRLVGGELSHRYHHRLINLPRMASDCRQEDDPPSPSFFLSRRNLGRTFVGRITGIFGLGAVLLESTVPTASAAPPIAVIAEELGYFPVSDANQETVYVPKRIRRESTDQAIQLARQLRASGAVSYTAFWCPHCARQRELWGREAWKELQNLECASKGYNAQPAVCFAKQVDGCKYIPTNPLVTLPSWYLALLPT